MMQDGSDRTFPFSTVHHDADEQTKLLRTMGNSLFNIGYTLEQMMFAQRRRHQEALENEKKSLQDELASQHRMQMLQQGQLQAEMEKAETKHRAEIAKWQAKDENERLAKQLKDEKEKHTNLQAAVWRKDAAVNYNEMAARVKQLEKEKADAVNAAEAATGAYFELARQYQQLEQRLEAKGGHILVEAGAAEIGADDIGEGGEEVAS